MLSNLVEFVDVRVGEALLGAAEEIRASPVAVDAQQTFSHVRLGGGNLSWKKRETKSSRQSDADRRQKSP